MLLFYSLWKMVMTFNIVASYLSRVKSTLFIPFVSIFIPIKCNIAIKIGVSIHPSIYYYYMVAIFFSSCHNTLQISAYQPKHFKFRTMLSIVNVSASTKKHVCIISFLIKIFWIACQITISFTFKPNECLCVRKCSIWMLNR